ncbi:MAG: peptidase S9 [Salinibacter sp.]
MISSRSVLVLCILLFVGPVGWGPEAAAQYFGRNKVQYDQFTFDILPTDYFDIYFYDETETAIRDVARMADRWHVRHSTVFSHDLTARRPLIFYANDADFQQTNVIGGEIGQGVGGVTEGLKQRVVMPLTGLYADTDHVLGHELVHSFQFDLALSTGQGIRLQRLPLWLIEGMAEYLSIGSEDPHTTMWVRDALVRDDLPTIRDLNTGRYFPYRFGQAYMAYLGQTYGDGAVTSLYQVAGQAGLTEGITLVTGMTPDSLSADWIRTVKRMYEPLVEGRTPAAEAGRQVLSDEAGTGSVNVSPALSPDGRYVAFLSSRDLFSIDLYVADAETGEIVKRLGSSNRDPHFDAIRFLNSAGTWSPDGRRFAFVAFAEGDNEIAIWNVRSGRIERRVAVQGVTALAQPAWSPDGETIAVSGMDGGISDLYLVDVAQGTARQLTDDRYGDLQPTWSPDGSQIAFVTDRGPGGTDFSMLRYGGPQLALLEVESGTITPLRPVDRGLQHNPKFAPDGRHLYFISDHDGFKDVHALDLDTDRTAPITRLQTGASGFTALSPAMTVASQSGRMMFSVFSDNEYAVVSLEPEVLAARRNGALVADTSEAPGPVAADSVTVTAPRVDTTIAAPAAADTTVLGTTGVPLPVRPGVLPPGTGPGVVDQALATPTAGLPTEPPGDVIPYRSRLQLDAIAPPTIGVGVGGGFGTRLGGSVGFYFSDMLGDHNLSIEALANGTLQDLGGQISYINRAQRLNYGTQLSHIPFRSVRGFSALVQDPATGETTLRFREIEERLFVNQFSVLGAYPLQNTRRFEVQTGLTRYGFSGTVRDFFQTPVGFRRDTRSLDVPDPLYLSQTAAAYVVDFTNFGFTSPVQGGRYRLQVGSTLGSTQYATVLADVRRYLRTGPVTFAGRAIHIGNYGASQGDLFSSEYLGDSFTPTYLRGYSFNSFEPEECFSETGRCGSLERLIGTRVAVASAEVRLPFLGTEQLGLINFPYLPTELSLFVDAGVAWTAEEAPVVKWSRDADERVPVVSTGISARMNVLGSLILEVFYAQPYQRPEKGGFIGVNLLPGW